MGVNEILDEIGRGRLSADGPTLLLDLDQVSATLSRFRAAMPKCRVLYAVKCNPERPILDRLALLGCDFEVSSVNEAGLLRGLGFDLTSAVFSLPVKSQRQIQAARECGISTFTVDSDDELGKIAAVAPRADVFVRIVVDDSRGHWPLSRKFGCPPETAVQYLADANDLGLTLQGVSFHVGSQNTDPAAWANGLRVCGQIMSDLADLGLYLRSINIGGGFPVAYNEEVPSIEEAGTSVGAALAALPYEVDLITEPGRHLVAEAGGLVTNVVGVTERDGRHWAYLDAGAFNGLFEGSSVGGDLSYKYTPLRAGLRLGLTRLKPFKLGGPTCDADDVVSGAIPLPDDLSEGDQILVFPGGAYTSAYSTVFCGASPPAIRIVGSELGGVGAPRATVDLRGRPDSNFYRVALPGSDLFDVAKALELELFRLHDFVGSDGTLMGYGPYEAASSFVVIEEDQQVAAVMRLIWPSPAGFKTLDDFELSPEAESQINGIGESRLVEVGTLATAPARRGEGDFGATFRAYHGLVDQALRHGATHVVASVDEGLLEAFRHGLAIAFRDLGPAKDYYGSVTAPVILDLEEQANLYRQEMPGFYEQVFLGRFDAAVAPA